jgi:hypothetical protein
VEAMYIVNKIASINVGFEDQKAAQIANGLEK